MNESGTYQGDVIPKTEIFETEKVRLKHLKYNECIQNAEELLKEIDGVVRVELIPDEEAALVTYDTRRTNIPLIYQTILRSGLKE
jgi:copper chaperone CopZ